MTPHPARGYQARYRPFVQTMLGFFPQYSQETLHIMELNVMAQWGVRVDPDIPFLTLVHWNDHIAADVRRKEQERNKKPAYIHWRK